MALLQRRLPSHHRSPRRAPPSGNDPCGIRAHVGRPHRLSRTTPEPLGQSVTWQALHAGGWLGPPPAGTAASLSFPPRPASPCQRDAASEPARQRSSAAAASTATASDAGGEPLGASLTLDGRSLPHRGGDIGGMARRWRLTPDRGSSESLCPRCSLVISPPLLCRPPSLLPRKPRANFPATAQLAERLAAHSRSDRAVPSSILGGRIWRGAAKSNALDL
jgi:hypothetical protein